jgi:LysR family transcriptional regulator for bpeEF and oprC
LTRWLSLISTVSPGAIANGGTARLTLRSGIMVNDTEAFVACGLNGLGLIQVPGLVVAEQLSTGALVEVVPEMVVASASEWLHPAADAR